MKRLVVTGALCLSLLVAAPVASATTSTGSPTMFSSWSSVSCSVSAAGQSWSWSFRLPSLALPYFKQAVATAQQFVPSLSCTYA